MTPLEKVIRPIVEGQIRGFIKEHPSILAGVNWYKPRDDKSVTLTNSLAKRIVRDLVCEFSRARIEQAYFDMWEAEKQSGVELRAAPDDDVSENSVGASSSSSVDTGYCGDSGQIGTFSDLAVAVASGKKLPTIILMGEA